VGAAPTSGCGDAERLDELERNSVEQQARRFRLEEGWRPQTEVEKIHALLDAVATSDATFLMGRRSWDGQRTRDFLRRRYVRAASRIVTAEQFIVGVASRQRVTNVAYEVLLPTGRRVDLREWLRGELARIERSDRARRHAAMLLRARAQGADGPTSEAGSSLAPTKPPARTDIPPVDVIETDDLARLPADFEDPVSHERIVPDTIDYVLALVRHSHATFVALDPPARGQRRATKGTRYDGRDFARMLQRKTTWIGAGIKELDPWLDEIGSRSFQHDLPYQVEHPDGRIEPFLLWVEARRHGPPERVATAQDGGAKDAGRGDPPREHGPAETTDGAEAELPSSAQQ